MSEKFIKNLVRSFVDQDKILQGATSFPIRHKSIDALPEKLLSGQLFAQTLLREQKLQEIERLKREVERTDLVIFYIQQKLDTSSK